MMSGAAIISIIVSLATLIGYINHRFIQMQPTIAIMASTMFLSVLLIAMGQLGLAQPLNLEMETLIYDLDFNNLVVNGFLGFLLFAGALNVDVHSLKRQKWEITTLAIFSTIASTFLVAIFIYYVVHWVGINLQFLHALLFGALISPTDPIAVMATLKQAKAPPSLEAQIAGESLFNDGVGIVLFVALYQMAFSHGVVFSSTDILWMLIQEGVGGILYGLLMGYLASFLIKDVTDHKVIVLITLSIVTGGYCLAQHLGLSGPLAIVAAGIFIGNRGKDILPKLAQERLHEFWELIDEILNAILFLLIGLELLQVEASNLELLAALCAIPVILLVRFLTVAFPITLFKIKRKYSPYTIIILTWSGLRGGLAVALALALPNIPQYPGLMLAMTYAVVAFSVIIQGTTTRLLVERSKKRLLEEIEESVQALE